MAIGNPLLATWDINGVVRLFEYTNNAFVQTGALGGFLHVTTASDNTLTGAQLYPSLVWVNDDSEMFIVHQSAGREVYSASLNAQAVQNGVSYRIEPANIDTYGQFRANDILKKYMLIGRNDITGNQHKVLLSRVDGTGLEARLTTYDGKGHKTRSISPDGVLVLAATVANIISLRALTINGTPANPSFDFGPNLAVPALTITPDLIAWAYDNATAVFVDKSARRAQSWFYDRAQNTWSMVHELVLPVGEPVAIKMSPDRRKVAISTLDGSTYRTKTYRRTGSFFIAEQDLTGIGSLLDFTNDGVILLDSWQRRAYRLNAEGQFIAENSIVASLPVSIRAQGVSQGRTDPYGLAQLYNGAPAALAGNTADLSNLKLTLLTDQAAFDPTDDSFGAATNNSDWELKTGMWPAGGVLLSNVIGVSGPGFYALHADRVARTLIETGATFRYALVYDATNDEPLVFVDLVQNRSFARNREIYLDFRDGEFVRFST